MYDYPIQFYMWMIENEGKKERFLLNEHHFFHSYETPSEI